MAPPKSRNVALLTLLLTVFIDMVGFGIIIPFMPFWAEKFGASPLEVTLLFSTYSTMAFLFSFFWGAVSDRYGRKPVLLLSLFGSVVSFIVIGFAESLWVLFVARAFGGLFGANIPVAQAFVADVTDPEDRAKGMGLMGAAFGLGFIVGPALGGLLAGPDPANPDFRTPFFVAAGVAALALVVGAIFLKEPERHRESTVPATMRARFRGYRDVIAHPVITISILVLVGLSFVMAGMESTFALFAERVLQWGPREMGYYFAYIGVLLVAIQGGLVGRVSKSIGEARTVPIATGCMVIGIGMLPWSDTTFLLCLAGIFIALGYGLGSPSLNSLISRNAPDDVQGAILGASQSTQSLCRILGPVTAGFLFEMFGRDMPYHVGAAILVLALILAMRLPAGLKKAEGP